MKCSPVVFVVISVLISTCILSCRVQPDSNNQVSSYYILILLEEGISPLDFEEFSSLDSDKVKKTSRSQNQWMVKHDSSRETMAEIVEKLTNTEGIKTIELIKEPNS